MQRVTRSTAAAVLPAAPVSPGTPGYFTGGDPVGAVPATVPGYEWFNGVQEELVAAILDAGLTLDAAVLTQLRQSMRRLSGGNVSALTVNTTLTADSAGVVGLAIAANRTFTLPAANAAGGRPIRLEFVRTDVTAFVATVQRAGADLIEGQTTITIPVGGRLTLVSDGVSAWLVVSESVPPSGIQAFTSSGSFVVPARVRRVRVRLWGGGGGGGGAFNNGQSGGGAAGGYAEGIYDVTPGASITVTVGAAGAGGNGSPTAGAGGGTTSFGVLISATGGAGGSAGNAASGGPSGAAGTGTGGAINLTGQRGSGGGLSTAGGAGGGAIGGAPTPSGALGDTGAAGVAPGAGGSGTAAGAAAGHAGGDGASGLVVVEW